MRMLIALSVLFISACAGKPLSKEHSDFVFVEQLPGIKKADAQQRAAVWIAKSVGDSNHAIKINDPHNGRLVSRISIACVNRYTIITGAECWNALYNVDFESKDDRAKITFESLGRRGCGSVAEFPVQESDKEALKICVETTKNELVAAIKAQKTDW